MSTSTTVKDLTYEEPFAFISGAVMCSPYGMEPIYREMAFAYNPKLQVSEPIERTNVWRFKNPFTFHQLSREQRQRENKIRRFEHGIDYSTGFTEEASCKEQHTVFWTIKKCWEQYGSLTPDKQLVVFYLEEEVGELLDLLGIPCANVNTTCDEETLYQYRRYLPDTYTCQFLHKYGQPCQATKAEHWAELVYDFLKRRQQHPTPVNLEDAVDDQEEYDENVHHT